MSLLIIEKRGWVPTKHYDDTLKTTGISMQEVRRNKLEDLS